MIVVDKNRVTKCPHCNGTNKQWLIQETVETLLCIDFYECMDCSTIYGKPFRAVQPEGLFYQEIPIKISTIKEV